MGHKRHKFRGSFENQAPGLTGPGITEPDYPAHMPNMVNGKPVVISLEHPENNPQGVTIEEFTEEVPRESFGINVGQQMEDLLKEHATKQVTHTTPNQKEEPKMEDTNKATVNNETKNQETKMNNESNNTNKATKQEESKMNEETKTQNTTSNQEQPKDNTKQEQPKVDPKVKPNTNQDAPKSEKDDLPDPNKKAERDGYSRSLGRECAGAFTVGASYGAGMIVGMAAGAAIVYGVRKLFGGSGEEAAQSTTETASNLF